MKKLAAFAVVLVGSFAVGASVAHADDDTSLEALLNEEVVTSVSKSAETATTAPALTRNISADEIRRYGMTSLDEALDFLGVGVHAEYKLGHAELSVRGVAFPGDRGNHVLLLIDGHVINEPLFGDAPIDERLGVPLELIDHIELVLGPGSTTYGTNAVLAVVNVVTKSASSNAGFHVAAEVGAQGTQRMTLTTGQQVDLFGKRASLTAGLTYFRRDDPVNLPKQTLTDLTSGQKYTWGGYADSSNRADVPGLYVHFVRDRLEVTARATSSKVGDPGGIGDFDQSGTSTLQRRASLAISQSVPLGHFGDLTGTLYADTFAEREGLVVSRAEACPYASSCSYQQRFASNRVGADLRANLDWLHDGRLVTLAGGSVSWDHVNAWEGALDSDRNKTFFPWTRNVTLDSVLTLAANAQQSWRPVSWLDVTAGARVDWRDVDDANGDGGGQTYNFKPVITPRLAIAAHPWDGATTKLIYAEAFRAPNPYELDGHSGVLLQARGLKPEQTSSMEAIFEQRVGEQRFMFGIFRSEYRGIINRLLLDNADALAALAARAPVPGLVYDPNFPLYQYRVADYVQTRGFNAGIDGALLHHRLRLGGSFTGSVARADQSQLLSIAPQWFGNARASYDFGGKLPVLAVASTFAGTALTDRAYNSGFSRLAFAPPSLEVRGTLTGAVPWVKGLSYRAIVAAQAHPTTPFAVGPALRAQPGVSQAALAPATPWNAILGLQYDF